MVKQDLIQLFEYMYWCTHRLLEHAAQLSNEQFLACGGATARNLRATLVHELDVEWSWRLRLSDQEDGGELVPDDFPDLAAIAARWAAEERAMRSWLMSLRDDDLEREIGPATLGKQYRLGDYLMHVLLHARQQHADVATLLSMEGQSPGELEYLGYLNDHVRVKVKQAATIPS
jgi:uncharacterized damage-inducible protein DinB